VPSEIPSSKQEETKKEQKHNLDQCQAINDLYNRYLVMRWSMLAPISHQEIDKFLTWNIKQKYRDIQNSYQ
jgi:hypothetical protein